ncbi:MAG: hypothetical protein GY953_08560 [bacterium]|nr:hypothetical protein [bacterium]
METHVRIVAVTRIVLGGLGALAGVACLFLFGSIAGLVSAVGVREDPDAWIAVWILAFVAGIAFVVLLVLSLPSIIAGIGLLYFRGWARVLTLVISAIDLLNVPFGTAIGAYSLWVLLSPETEALFRRGRYVQRVA